MGRPMWKSLSGPGTSATAASSWDKPLWAALAGEGRCVDLPAAALGTPPLPETPCVPPTHSHHSISTCTFAPGQTRPGLRLPWRWGVRVWGQAPF